MSLVIEQGGMADIYESWDLQPEADKKLSSFLVAEPITDRHVVVPDMHGEHRLLDRIINQYTDQSDVNFVLLGDIIDRKSVDNDPEKGVYKTLQIIKDLGQRAVVTMANHEWWLHASSRATDQTLRQQVLSGWLGTNPKNSIERNTLTAYNLDPTIRDEVAVDELTKRMARFGHLAILNSASPYYETDKFIAVHAGVLSGVPWEMQQGYLRSVASYMNDGQFHERPPQWFSMKLATDTSPVDATDKTVISGHAHILDDRRHNQSRERSLHDGRRIRLASQINAPAKSSAYVWQDWDGKVIEIAHPDNDEA